MANQLAKQTSLMLKLKEQISLILPASTIVQTADANGVMLQVSQSATPTAGQANMAIRITQMSTDFTDSLGLSQNIYAPSVMQVIEESASEAGVSIVPMASKGALDGELEKMGVRQERWLNPNGTAPTASQFGAALAVSTASKVATLEPSLQFPLSGQ